MAVILGQNEISEWLDKLQGMGLVPPETCRVIIDIDMESVVKVYYECNADERMFQIDPAKLLDGAEAISVTEAAKR